MSSSSGSSACAQYLLSSVTPYVSRCVMAWLLMYVTQ